MGIDLNYTMNGGVELNLKLATRKSKLAQVQTDYVMDLVEELHNIKCEKVLTDTLGDKRLDVTLDKIGGKGVFIKELEKLMIDGKAHGGVHSMKDVPYELPDGFYIAATPIRWFLYCCYTNKGRCKGCLCFYEWGFIFSFA